MKPFYLFLISISAALFCACSNEDLADNIGNEVFNPDKVEKEIDNKLLADFINGETSVSYTIKEVHQYELSDRTGMEWHCIDDSLLLIGLNPFFIPDEININDGLFWIKNNYWNNYDKYGHQMLFEAWGQYLYDTGIDGLDQKCYITFPVTENDWNDISYGYKVEIEKISNDEIRLAYVLVTEVYGYENPCITRKIFTYGRVADEYSPMDIPSYLTVKERDRYMIDRLAEYYGENATIFNSYMTNPVSIVELRRIYL